MISRCQFGEWIVEVAGLRGQKPYSDPYEQNRFYESPAGKFGALIYGVEKRRMGYYLGRLAVFEGPPKKSKLLVDFEDKSTRVEGSWLPVNIFTLQVFENKSWQWMTIHVQNREVFFSDKKPELAILDKVSWQPI